MKVQTVVEKRVSKNAPENSLMYAMLMTMDTFVNVLLPFMFGLYFARTKSLVFIALIFVFLFVRINFDMKKERIILKIVRGF